MSFPLLSLSVSLLGGLALFLFGLDQMSSALKALAGDRMKALIARLTGNRLLGVLTGGLATAAIQSSSVTTVLVVGFVTAGLMSLTQSVGVILGANVGATVTVQILAFKVTRLALGMIAVGFALTVPGSPWRFRRHGMALFGLGLVFLGMGMMGDAMTPLRGDPTLLGIMARLEDPVLGILVGAAFTALIQSSAATAGILMALAGQGLLTLPAGIALILGANIGTCSTALLATFGKPREALRAAVVHILFNLLGVLLWAPFLPLLAHLAEAISPVAAGLAGVEKAATELPRQIANAHSLFNVVNVLLFLPATTWLARFVEVLVPDRTPEGAAVLRPKYLDLQLLDSPSLALDRARLELLNMGDQVRSMMVAILPAVLTGSREDLATVEAMDDVVDHLHGQIVTYLGKISQTELTEGQTTELIRLMEAANDLENIGDVIEINLVALGRERLDLGVTVSELTRDVIEGFHRAVSRALDAALVAGAQRNTEAAGVVMHMKGEINRLEGSAVLHKAKRLVAQEPNRLPAYTVETDVLKNLKRIYYFARRMARETTGHGVDG